MAVPSACFFFLPSINKIFTSNFANHDSTHENPQQKVTVTITNTTHVPTSQANMASFLITGASRGLGLAFTKELVSRPASEVGKIVAAARKPSADLESVAKDSSGRVSIVILDVADEASVKKAVAEVETALGGKGLDVLINNAGIAQYAMEGTKSMDNLEESMRVNVLGVHWVTRNFLPLLQKGELKKVANM